MLEPIPSSQAGKYPERMASPSRSNSDSHINQTPKKFWDKQWRICVPAVEMLSQRLLCLQSSMIHTDHISPVHCSTLWSSCTCLGNSTFMKHVVLSLNLIEMQWHLVAIWGEGHAIQYIQPCLIYDIQWRSNTAFESHGSRLWVIHQ